MLKVLTLLKIMEEKLISRDFIDTLLFNFKKEYSSESEINTNIDNIKQNILFLLNQKQLLDELDFKKFFIETCLPKIKEEFFNSLQSKLSLEEHIHHKFDELKFKFQNKLKETEFLLKHYNYLLDNFNSLINNKI